MQSVFFQSHVSEKNGTIYFSKDTFSQISISCSGILRSKNVYYIPFLDSTKHKCLSTFPLQAQRLGSASWSGWPFRNVWGNPQPLCEQMQNHSSFSHTGEGKVLNLCVVYSHEKCYIFASCILTKNTLLFVEDLLLAPQVL